jgi:trans-aconitate methyltransferase
VSLLAAEFVGPSGTEVGIDSSRRAVDAARLRADQAGFPNVSFSEADLHNYVSPRQFDAIVGRSVLMYLPDPEQPCVTCCNPSGQAVSLPGEKASTVSRRGAQKPDSPD